MCCSKRNAIMVITAPCPHSYKWNQSVPSDAKREVDIQLNSNPYKPISWLFHSIEMIIPMKQKISRPNKAKNITCKDKQLVRIKLTYNKGKHFPTSANKNKACVLCAGSLFGLFGSFKLGFKFAFPFLSVMDAVGAELACDADVNCVAVSKAGSL